MVALRQPAGTDVLLGWTRGRALVLWRYNAAAAHRAFPTGAEGCAQRPPAAPLPVSLDYELIVSECSGCLVEVYQLGL